jgi:hypothetical protein
VLELTLHGDIYLVMGRVVGPPSCVLRPAPAVGLKAKEVMAFGTNCGSSICYCTRTCLGRVVPVDDIGIS